MSLTYPSPASGTENAPTGDAEVPRTYQVRTFGCQMNVHDSERMAGMLEAAGFERVSFRNLNAGIVAIHTGYRV